MLNSMQFSDRVQTTSYSDSRNILFLASRDGKFYAWKLPKQWRSELVEKQEREIMIRFREERRAEEQRQMEIINRKHPIPA